MAQVAFADAASRISKRGFEISQIRWVGDRQPGLRLVGDDRVQLGRPRAAFCRSAARLLQRKERWPRLPMVHSKVNLVEGVTAMKLPKNRNDRVMVGMGAAIAGMIVAACVTSVASDPQLTELCSLSRLFGNSASAAEEPSKPRMYHAQPANGPVPLAHKVSKIVKADSPISIVRDPVDLPPPIGGRAPRRVKVELETIEVTGNLADGATYRYWTFNQKVPGPFIRVRYGRSAPQES